MIISKGTRRNTATASRSSGAKHRKTRTGTTAIAKNTSTRSVATGVKSASRSGAKPKKPTSGYGSKRPRKSMRAKSAGLQSGSKPKRTYEYCVTQSLGWLSLALEIKNER